MCQRNITVASLAALEEMKCIAGCDVRDGEPQTCPPDKIALCALK